METDQENNGSGEKKTKRKNGMPHAYDLMPNKAPLRLHCEWGDCQEEYANMNAFRKHIQGHLWDLFNTVKGTENECEAFGKLIHRVGGWLHEFHETCHSVTLIVLVNSHQR